MIPVRLTPGGNHSILYSDLQTIQIYSKPVTIMIYDSNPPHPLNKKRENIEERVLKGKLFKNSVQQSNSPTTLYFLKCNSLLYSSIYSFLNYIYIQHTCCFVGCCWIHCWTCFQRFSKKKKFNPTKSLFVGRVGRPPTLF